MLTIEIKLIPTAVLKANFKEKFCLNKIIVSKIMLVIIPLIIAKTMIAKTVAKYLDVPFAIGDATSLTESGYVGDDVETLIARLLTASDGDVARAQRGVIFIDELDKISRKSESSSIFVWSIK